jgi:CRP/FNR family transcriptional regulator, anaerobic regulatory protein
MDIEQMNSKGTSMHKALEPVFHYFDTILPLKENERIEFQNRMYERKIRRKQFILQQDDVCKHYTFIVSGCFRMFGVDSKGIEHNIQFAAENDWISDIGSFYSEKPSKLYIEALEPSLVLQIEKKDLLFLYTNFSRVNRNFRVIIENKFVELQNRVLQNISSTVEERYVTFLEQYPSLSNRLPSTQIASYLGVTPEFLSKVRKGLSGKKS